MRFPGSFLVAVLLVFSFVAAPLGHTGATATDPACPAGTSPNPWTPVGDLYLPNGAIPYSTIVLTRHTLNPGETLPAELDVPIMYVVESGRLEYPPQAGVGIMSTLYCQPDDGIISMSGSILSAEDGYTVVEAGSTMIAEHGLIGPLRAGGSSALVMLEVRMLIPEIDPSTGLPIVDPLIAAREQNRDFRLRKEECKQRARSIAKGTPVAPLPAPPVYIETPEPTPAFTTTGWLSDGDHERYKVPRICKGTRDRE